MRTLLSVIAAAAVLMAPLTYAKSSPYSYAGLQYVSESNGGVSFSGLGLSARYPIQPNVFVTGSWDSLSGSGVTSSTLSGGAGYHAPINSTADWYAQAEFVSASSFGASQSGFAIAGGIVANLQPQIDIDASVSDTSIGGSSTTGINVIGIYHINRQYSADVGLGSANGSSSFSIGARMALQ